MAGYIFKRNKGVKMDRILTVEESIEVSNKLRGENKKVVLVGGCFDLIHVGHIKFLKEAKKYGYTFVLLECDESIKKLKGEGRPITPLLERAEILASISYVDYVIILNKMINDDEYTKLVRNIKPNFIAITKGDSLKSVKEKQAKDIDAEIIEVTEKVEDKSSSRLAQLLRNINI
ncbi:MAG: hypothetical protein A2152_02720 [Candidatus Levybacteria bacterium RBG_16_35_6]|nr:MAG: hypothetical protein A2152_02720 [Candidatus Levybacteria bacterium RBG_16_35_6]